MTAKEIKALFLGPKSENYPVFKEMLGYMMDDYAEWRRSFHPDDPLVITPQEQQEDGFKKTLMEMRRVLVELAGSPSGDFRTLVLAPLSGAHECRYPDGSQPGLYACSSL